MLVVAGGSAGAQEVPARGSSLSVFLWQTAEQDFGDAARLSGRTQRLDWHAAPKRIGRFQVALGASYDYTRFEYTGVASRNRDLHRLQLPVSVVAEAGAWQWRTVIAPGVATSSNVMKDLLARGGSDDLYVTGAVVATRTTGPRTLSLGVASDRRFGRSATYPLIALRGGSDTLRWQLGAPDAWLDWRVCAGTMLGVGAAPAGMQWHVVRDDFQSDFDYRQRRWDVRVFARQRLGSRYFVSVHAGRGFDRRHRFEADLAVPVADDVDDAWSFGIRIGWGTALRANGYAHAW